MLQLSGVDEVQLFCGNSQFHRQKLFVMDPIPCQMLPIKGRRICQEIFGCLSVIAVEMSADISPDLLCPILCGLGKDNLLSSCLQSQDGIPLSQGQSGSVDLYFDGTLLTETGKGIIKTENLPA